MKSNVNEKDWLKLHEANISVNCRYPGKPMIEVDSANKMADQVAAVEFDSPENLSDLAGNNSFMEHITSDNLWNMSLLEYFNRHRLIERYKNNRHFEWTVLYMFIFAYGILIVFGTIGNCLAVSAVIRKPSMRTPRNMFIINLAVSDLLLCVITMPLTLMEIVTVYWPLGNHVYLCKMFGSLQAISIFVSTISITAIALDRYHVRVFKYLIDKCVHKILSRVLGISF